MVRPSAHRADTQSIASASPGALSRSSRRARPTKAVAAVTSGSLAAGTAPPDDGRRPLEIRVVDPVVEAAALQRVVELAAAVGGEHDDRAAAAVKVPSSGTVTEPSPRNSNSSASNSSSARSISSMRSTGALRALVADAAQDRPLVQELLGEQVGLGQPVVAGLREADGEDLALVVPLVERLGRGEALVALEPDERRAERAGHRVRRRGLADPGLTLEEERTAERQREVERGRRPSSTR